MVTRERLQKALNDALQPPENMADASNNGLQVEGIDEIERVAFGVDASVALFQAAVEWNAHAVIVHHGISWGSGFATITGPDARRIALLLNNNVNLFAYHLPLDCHPVLGNNAQIAARLELKNTQPFGQYGGIDIGVKGTLPKSMPLQELDERVKNCLETKTDVLSAEQNPMLNTVGIVSGGGADLIAQCAAQDVDCLITGEVAHQHVHPIYEANVPVIAAGHYATETWGLKALMQYLQKTLPLECAFLDLPTGY